MNDLHARPRPLPYISSVDLSLAVHLVSLGISQHTACHTLQLPAALLARVLAAADVAPAAQPRVAQARFCPVDGFRFERRAGEACASDAREPEDIALDSLWSLQRQLSAASLFIANALTSQCAVCALPLRSSSCAEVALEYPSAAAVGTLASAVTSPRGQLRGDRPLRVVWGVDEVCCEPCWPSYAPKVAARLEQRRLDVGAYVLEHRTRARRSPDAAGRRAGAVSGLRADQPTLAAA